MSDAIRRLCAAPVSPRRRLARLSMPIVLAIGLLGCAAERDHNAGMSEMAGGDREKGLALLARASHAEPSNSQFRLDYLQQQALAERDALSRGDDARREGKYDDAKRWYGTALRIDPASDRALRGLANVDMDARHVTALAEIDSDLQGGKLEAAEALLHKVMLEDPANLTAQKLAVQLSDKQEAKEQAAADRIAASSVMKRPVSLQFRDANLRLVFEALSRTTGLNVIFDKDVKADLKTTIFVHDASVEDTVDMILLQSQLSKKELNANTLFIYPNTAAKQKDYQDLKLRVFQLSNVDGKYIQTLLKSTLKGSEINLDEKSNTLVLRGTQDMISIAEKLIAAHDLPDPEVMLEVEVLEISKDRLTDLGIQWPSQFAVGTPSSTTTISALAHTPVNALTVTSLSATLNAALTDTDTNILASPRIRVRDKQKAKILIGDKVPVFTNSVTPTATTSVVTGTVTYLDVGIKLNVEPHVYREGDVGINMDIEVSNIVKEISNSQSGSVAYEIGTRSAQTSLRLRDGETQILAGLINDQTNATSNLVPGLGQFPILDHLFGSENRDHTKDEIVLSITPHILRAPATADRHDRDVFAGTESAVREHPLRLDPVSAVSDSAKSSAANPPAAAPVTPGFVGGGGGGVAPTFVAPTTVNNVAPPSVAPPTPRRQHSMPGAPVTGAVGSRPGDPGVFQAPTPPSMPEPAPAPEAPEAAPAEAPAAAPVEPAPAAPAAPPPPAIPAPPPAVGGSVTPSTF